MKPLHIGFLLVGAALAGGLAVKMTEQLPIPVEGPPAQSASPFANVPAVVIPPPAPKPSPLADPVPHTHALAPFPARAAAPQPVYGETPKPAIRKYKPILMAGAKPTQWTPVPYRGQPPDRGQPPVKAQPAASAPAEQTVVEEPAPSALVPAPRQVTLLTGMTIPVRLDEFLSSDRSVVGDRFYASLAEPLVVDGLVIAEKGARVTGRIVDLQKAGRAGSTSSLQLGLATLRTSDGQQVVIPTDPWSKPGDPSVPSETIIRFRVTSRVTITEQQIAGRQ